MQTSIKNKEFIYEIIHDIKSPILSIDYALKNIQRNELLDEIYKINKNSLHYIENLLSNYSISDEKYDLKFKETNIIEIIKEEIENLTPIIKDKKLKIEFKSSEQKIIFTDELILRQIILNLLTNSIKYANINSKISIDINNKENFLEICFKNPFIEPKSNIHSNGMGLEIIIRKIKLLGGNFKITKDENVFCFNISFKY